AGPPTTQVNDRMRLPGTYSLIWRTKEADWGYYTEDQTMPGTVDPTKEVLNKGFVYPRAKIWGGCSSVNGMIYIRGQKKDYELWAEQGPEYKIWDWEHSFKAVENNARENPSEEFKKYHGFDGLLHVQDNPKSIYKIVSDVVEVAKNLGIPHNEDFNGVRQNGVGGHQHTIKDGKRFSLADGYLADALKKVEIYPESKPLGPPYGLPDEVGKFVAVNVKSHAHALNIIWDKENKDENVAIGVRYFYDGGVHNAFIAPKGEVILCGGAINSPQILMLSGIGPKENLEANNIKVRKELPVGRNLWDHPLCFLSGKVKNPGMESVPRLHTWSSGLEIGIFHKGNVEGKLPSKEDFLDERPDMQLYATPSILDPAITTKFESLTISLVLNIPSSVGHLELRSPDPFTQPNIFLNYYSKPDDLYRMMSSLKLAREIFKQPPLNTVWGVEEVGLNDEFGKWSSGKDGEMTDEDWERYIREKSFTSFHPCGTVKMAPESQGGVVDHRLQVYGTKNLRVIDASIFPMVPSGNTNAPTAM
ncbi:15675_t:CDS:2, partial [Acaulospora morrowiae]